MGSGRTGAARADIIPQLIPDFLMLGERKQKCSQAKNFFDWTNKNVGTIFLPKYLSVSLVYFKHHSECFRWTNVRWAMLGVMTSNVWSFPEIDIISPWHLLHHNVPPPHMSLPPNMPDLMTRPTHLGIRPDSRPSSRPGWRSPETRWTSQTSPCGSRRWECPTFGIGAKIERMLFNFLQQNGFVSYEITSFLHQHTVKMPSLFSWNATHFNKLSNILNSSEV